jgi:hypothetical protein
MDSPWNPPILDATWVGWHWCSRVRYLQWLKKKKGQGTPHVAVASTPAGPPPKVSSPIWGLSFVDRVFPTCRFLVLVAWERARPPCALMWIPPLWLHWLFWPTVEGSRMVDEWLTLTSSLHIQVVYSRQSSRALAECRPAGPAAMYSTTCQHSNTCNNCAVHEHNIGVL